MKWIAIAITVNKKTILFPCGGLINRRTTMKVAELILMLEKYNANAEVTVNCPDTNKTRDIWYVQQDDDPEHSNNFIDIVLTKENEDETGY